MIKHIAIRLSLALGLLLALMALASSALARSKSVVVQRRDGDITVLSNGDMRVVETWEVQFSGGPFTQAFRTIPLNRADDIFNWDIREGGPRGRPFQQNDSAHAYTFTLDDHRREQTITWHFPATTNASRTFALSYTVRGALRIYPDGDQVFFKFIEADRQYTINSAHVAVHLPTTFATNQIKATTYMNTVESQAVSRVDGQTVEFTGGPFHSGDEWEIRAQFPHGVVTASAPAWQSIEDRRPVYNLIAIFSASMIAMVGFSGLYLLWDMYGRDRPARMAARYYPQPPDDTPPGLVGVLFDERADLRDIVATIVDLARRGFLRIVEISGSGVLSTRDFAFVRTDADASRLQPYERRLLDTIFGPANECYLSNLRNKFHTAIPDLKHCMYDAAVRSGYFAQNPQQTRYKFAGIGIGGLALVILVGGSSYPFVVTYTPLAFWVVIAAAAVAVGFIALSPFIPQKTLKGATAAARWRAFKRYLEHIDRYTSVAAASAHFDQYLPYAIAFGLERDFVQKFAAVDTPAPDWYQPFPVFLGPSDHYSPVGRTRADWINGMAATNGGMALPSLDGMAHNLSSSLDAISGEFFNMLDATATALTSQSDRLDGANVGKDGLFNWIGRDNDDGGFSGGWSGGGGFGGGGFGGGSSGFK